MRPACRVAPLLLLLAAAAPAARAQTPGLTPLDDLGAGLYLGVQGGLYPGGSNAPPEAHLDHAMRRAANIVPRRADGAPDPAGVIVVLAVGMSNTNQEFAVFERSEDQNPERNARVVLVDGGAGGWDAALIANPAAAYWTGIAQRLSAMGVTPSQVQVVWLKESEQGPSSGFPSFALTLRDHLEQIVQILHDAFPTLGLCYLSSRIYGGYGASGEPKAYESAFAVKWLVEDQIGGAPSLNHGQLPGLVRSPVLLWGPYLWANGPTPRSDGLAWSASDLEPDFTHPSPGGEQKVAGLLSAFFAADPTASSWWPRRRESGLIALGASKDTYVEASSPASNFGSASTLVAQGGASPSNVLLQFDLPAPVGAAAWAKVSLRVPTDQVGGGRVSAVGSTSWAENGVSWSTAPAIGSLIATTPQSSRDGTIAANVAATVTTDTDGAVGLAITSPAASASVFHSREAGQSPRLVIALDCSGGGPSAFGDADGDAVADPCDCAPLDPSVWARPGEIAGLRWLSGTLLAWDTESPASGSAARYDVMSGALGEVSRLWAGAQDFCAGSDLTVAQMMDPSPPPAPGQGRYHLVRATNACGNGRWETASDGRDRLAPGCP